MAKAVIITACDRCKKEFKVTKKCYNTKEKESFETWAMKNITTCHTCLKKINIKQAVKSGDATIERMSYKLYKTKWATCKTVPDSYDVETKNIDVVITKKDRAIHDTIEVLPDDKKNNKDFIKQWAWNFDNIEKQLPIKLPPDAPDWGNKVAEIVNTIYGVQQ